MLPLLLTVRHRSWLGVVYELLAEYRPANEANYRRLQDQAREGVMTSDAVTDRARARFLQK